MRDLISVFPLWICWMVPEKTISMNIYDFAKIMNIVYAIGFNIVLFNWFPFLGILDQNVWWTFHQGLKVYKIRNLLSSEANYSEIYLCRYVGLFKANLLIFCVDIEHIVLSSHLMSRKKKKKSCSTLSDWSLTCQGHRRKSPCTF